MNREVDGMSLSKDTIYSEARKELQEHMRRNGVTQSWSIAAVGAAMALVARAVTSAPAADEVLVKDPLSLCIAAVVAGSFINVALWHVALTSARSARRVGAFLLLVEKEADCKRGWEHWFWYRAHHSHGLVFEILGDINTWIAGAYLSGAFWLLFLSPSLGSGLGIFAALGTLLAGVGLRIHTHRYRDRIVNTALEDLEVDNWLE